MDLLKVSYYTYILDTENQDQCLVYNTLSSALLLVAFEEGSLLRQWSKLESIPQDQLSDENPEFVDNLLQCNILIPENVNEQENIRAIIRKERKREYERGNIVLTITPTISCNMGCSYCFEGEKPISSVISEKTIQDLMAFLRREVRLKRFVERFSSLSVTWYGGEPLLHAGVIGQLGEQLTGFAKESGLKYSSAIITNGLGLDSKTWKILEDASVKTVQITIDGARDTHNLSRPILPLYGSNDSDDNYFRIIENIAQKPESIKVFIRVNTDRNTYAGIDTLLEDLRQKNAWPQQAKTVSIYLAHKRPPRESSNVEYDTEGFFTKAQFYRIEDEFRHTKLKHYNNWATRVGKPPGRLSFEFPKQTFSFLCSSASLPYSIVLDPDGFVHQCWEHVNEPDTRSHHISSEYVIDHPAKKEFMEWDKFAHPVCSKCKMFPVCNKTCVLEEPPELCTDWKFMIKERMKSQFQMSVSEPDQIESFEEFAARR